MQSRQIDFSKGSIRKNVWQVAAPMLAAQILNLLYNIVDRIYIGMLPEEGAYALAGLGLCFPVITFITAFANLFGLGGAPLFGIQRGRGDMDEAGRIMGTSFVMLILTGLILTAAGLVFHKPLLYLFGASDQTYRYAGDYMVIYLIGTVFVMIALGMNPFINGQGFARTGMLTVLLGALTNIVLDPVFIFIFGMGVKGAALATILSQFLSALWVLWFLTGPKAELTLKKENLRLSLPRVKRILALGSSSFFMSCTDSMVQVACNKMLYLFGGDIYVSVMSVISSIRQIAQTPVMAVTDGVSPVISYNYGAGNNKRVKEAIRLITWVSIVYTTAVWLLLFVFPGFFIGIFNRDALLMEKAIPSLHIYFFGFFMMALQFAGQSVFKALNKAKHAVFFSLLRKAIIVVPLTLLLPYIGGLGTTGVFLAEPISNVIGGTACFVTMLRVVLPELKEREKTGPA